MLVVAWATGSTFFSVSGPMCSCASFTQCCLLPGREPTYSSLHATHEGLSLHLPPGFLLWGCHLLLPCPLLHLCPLLGLSPLDALGCLHPSPLMSSIPPPCGDRGSTSHWGCTGIHLRRTRRAASRPAWQWSRHHILLEGHWLCQTVFLLPDAWGREH